MTGPPERDPELERLRQELLLLGIRAAILKEEVERRLREGASLVDTSRQLREVSQAMMDRRRRRYQGR